MVTAGGQRGEDQTEVADTVAVRMGGRGTALVAVQQAVGRKEDGDMMLVVADRAVALMVAARREAADRVVGSGYSSCAMHSSRC